MALSDKVLKKLAQQMQKQALGENPSVYVGTYGKYNSGSIQGGWVDLSQFADIDDFYDHIRQMHSDEPDPEFMFQDWDLVPDWAISESHLDPEFFEFMELTNEWDEDNRKAFSIYLDNISGKGANPIEELSDFEDAYVGKFDRFQDYAEEYVADIGIENIGNLKTYFNREMFERDLGFEGYHEATEDDVEDSPEEYPEGTGVYFDGEHQGYDTIEDMVDSVLDEGLIGEKTFYFDYERFARELQYDYSYIEGHVFRNM